MIGKKDPIQKYGGKPLSAIATLAITVIMLVAGTGALVWGYLDEGYEEVETLASVKCFGCLGLDPRIDGFSEFWDVYPDGHEKEGQPVDHRPIVLNTLNDEDVDLMILFFWGPGCVPCAEQWEEMVEEDIASGHEEGGKEGDAYEGLRLHSVDASRDDENLYWTYHFNGKKEYNGIPRTVFLFNGYDDIMWYSHYGKMDINEVAGMIKDIQQIVLEIREHERYHDISHA